MFLIKVSVFPPLLLSLDIAHPRAELRWGCGVFDAAAGAALLSVVDLPDLGTVNRQG